MDLNKLLVSYNRVFPDYEYEIDLELPMSRYERFTQYINNRLSQKNPISEEIQELTLEEPIDFQGWDYSHVPTSKKELKSPTFKSKSDWVNLLAASYRKLGLSENAIKNLIAKNAHESAWGKSALGRYNYGNITTGKSWKGDYVDGKDHDAKGNEIKLRFRSYNSLDEFAKNEVDFLTNSYDFNPNDDFETFANKLLGNNKKGLHYAEDPKYIEKVRGVYNSLG